MSTDTRSILVEIATAQVRRQGYAGFSYADLAHEAGIRKPSIHHHFPAKEDLGLAIVNAYTDRFTGKLEEIAAKHAGAADRIRAYGRSYREALSDGRGCLCGVLASEVATLPERVRAAVRQFFELHLQWLESTLRAGRSDGSLRADLEPRREARTVLATLQGAMFVSLSIEEPATLDQALAGLLKGLAPWN